MKESIFKWILLSIIILLQFVASKIAFYIYINYIYNKELEDQRADNSLTLAKKYNLAFNRFVSQEIQKREYNDSDITSLYFRFIYFRNLTSYYYCNYIYGDINNTSFIINERVVYAPRILEFQHIYIVKKVIV